MLSSGYKFIEIPRMDCESFQDYLERSYFVINNLKSRKYTYDVLLEKSLLYHSIKVLKCNYSSKSMDQIKEMSKFAGVRI